MLKSPQSIIDFYFLSGIPAIYHLRLKDELGEELKRMSNLGEGIRERGVAVGKQEGFVAGKQEGFAGGGDLAKEIRKQMK